MWLIKISFFFSHLVNVFMSFQNIEKQGGSVRKSSDIDRFAHQVVLLFNNILLHWGDGGSCTESACQTIPDGCGQPTTCAEWYSSTQPGGACADICDCLKYEEQSNLMCLSGNIMALLHKKFTECFEMEPNVTRQSHGIKKCCTIECPKILVTILKLHQLFNKMFFLKRCIFVHHLHHSSNYISRRLQYLRLFCVTYYF